MKPLRGTPLDVFGYTHERRTERQLIRDFEALIEEIVAKLDAGNHAMAVGLANIPQKIRGFGHVKERNLESGEGGGGRPPRQVPQWAAAAADCGGVKDSTIVIPDGEADPGS